MKRLMFFIFLLLLALYACKKEDTISSNPTNTQKKPVAKFMVPDTIDLDTVSGIYVLRPINQSTDATQYVWEGIGPSNINASPEFNLVTPGNMTLKLTASSSLGSSTYSKSFFVQTTPCNLHFKINSTSTFISASVYFWGSDKFVSSVNEFDIKLPGFNIGGTVGDLKLNVKTSAFPNGKVYTCTSFVIYYKTYLTFNTQKNGS